MLSLIRPKCPHCHTVGSRHGATEPPSQPRSGNCRLTAHRDATHGPPHCHPARSADATLPTLPHCHPAHSADATLPTLPQCRVAPWCDRATQPTAIWQLPPHRPPRCASPPTAMPPTARRTATLHAPPMPLCPHCRNVGSRHGATLHSGLGWGIE